MLSRGDCLPSWYRKGDSERAALRAVIPLSTLGLPIAGHAIPAGTRLVLNKLSLYSDPDRFPEPARFDPVRCGRGELGPQLLTTYWIT